MTDPDGLNPMTKETNMNEQYQFVFTTEQLVMIDKAIQQMPYYMAAPLLNEINKQIESQRKQIESQRKQADSKD